MSREKRSPLIRGRELRVRLPFRNICGVTDREDLRLLASQAIRHRSDPFRLPFAIALALAVHGKIYEDYILTPRMVF